MWLLAAVSFTATPSVVSAQEVTPPEDLRPYNAIADAVAKAITAELPEWKRASVPPVSQDGPYYSSHEVIIDQWWSDEGRVRVAILFHPSEADAKDKFEKFVADDKAGEHLPDGDVEAYAWGLNKSVALRSGSYTIYIGSVITTLSDEEQASGKASKEEAKLSKMFAKIVAKALKGT
ncbi:MAG TPA: hypothetical protein VJ715_09980 [Pyrinomonadaceae bacterium]|nr:hypothetical protein [Pyrinomonadaceae bacterium]